MYQDIYFTLESNFMNKQNILSVIHILYTIKGSFNKTNIQHHYYDMYQQGTFKDIEKIIHQLMILVRNRTKNIFIYSTNFR